MQTGVSKVLVQLLFCSEEASRNYRWCGFVNQAIDNQHAASDQAMFYSWKRNWNTHLSGGWQRFVLPQSISQCGQNWNLPLIGLGQHCLVLLFPVTVAVQVILRSSLRWTTRTLTLPLHYSLRVIRGWGRRGWKEFERAIGISPYFMEFLRSGLYYERIDLRSWKNLSLCVIHHWCYSDATASRRAWIPSQLLRHFSSLTVTLWLNLYRISLKFGSRGQGSILVVIHGNCYNAFAWWKWTVSVARPLVEGKRSFLNETEQYLLETQIAIGNSRETNNAVS